MVGMPTMESMIAEALRNQIPVKALPGVSIANVQEQPEQPFDISFDLLSGPNQIRVLGEVKPTFSPRVLEEIGPWIRRLKSLRTDVAVAVIAPQLSSQAQMFCIENGIDFLDLAGMPLSMFLESSRCSGTVCARAANSQHPLKAHVPSTSFLDVSPVSCESSCSSLDHGALVKLQGSLKKRAHSSGNDSEDGSRFHNQSRICIQGNHGSRRTTRSSPARNCHSRTRTSPPSSDVGG